MSAAQHQPASADPCLAEPPRSGGRGLFRALVRPRLRRVDVLVALLLAVLGFAAAVQVRTTQDDGPLATARQEDLVTILDDLSNRNDRLRSEIAALTESQRRLTTGTGQSEAALAEARRRAQLLGVLAGTVPARGPGVELTIADPDGALSADVLLDALEELRDAGAEAVQLEGAQGQAVRVVASTALLDGDRGGATVGGTPLLAPYRFLVIGDPSTLSAALAIPGGVVDNVELRGGRALVERRDEVVVDALQSLDEPRYARPAPQDD
jgi:uncharacterized protein YlxW (UPF0749 family)